MSFLSAEISIFGGKPIELYKFKRGNQTWLLNTSKKIVTYNGENYQPDYVKRDNLRSTASLGRQQISVTIKAKHALAGSYIGGMPTRATTLTIFRQHIGEAEVGTVWAGRITSIEFAGDEATVKCDPLSTALKRIGLHATYQVLCRHVHYGPMCRAIDNQIAGSVVSINGLKVTVNIGGTPADNFFSGGTLRNTDDAWLIVEQLGSVLTLASPPLSLPSGSAVTLSAGCDHTPGAGGCAKFNNLDNYGGFPFMPNRNPFGNDPIV